MDSKSPEVSETEGEFVFSQEDQPHCLKLGATVGVTAAGLTVESITKQLKQFNYLNINAEAVWHQIHDSVTHQDNKTI